MFWQGHYLSDAAAFMPWALFATDAVVRNLRGYGGPGLGLSMGAVAMTGVPDVLDETLLASSLYAVHRQVALHGWSLRALVRPAVAVILGWVLGILLGAICLLPLAESRRPDRRIQESEGAEERPPVGLNALAQAVLPFCNGSHEEVEVPCYVGKLVLPESSATAMRGCSPRDVPARPGFRRSATKASGFILVRARIARHGVALGLPGLISLWRLPGFDLVSAQSRHSPHGIFGLVSWSIGLDACARAPASAGRWVWRWRFSPAWPAGPWIGHSTLPTRLPSRWKKFRRTGTE